MFIWKSDDKINISNNKSISKWDHIQIIENEMRLSFSQYEQSDKRDKYIDSFAYMRMKR